MPIHGFEHVCSSSTKESGGGGGGGGRHKHSLAAFEHDSCTVNQENVMTRASKVVEKFPASIKPIQVHVLNPSKRTTTMCQVHAGMQERN